LDSMQLLERQTRDFRVMNRGLFAVTLFIAVLAVGAYGGEGAAAPLVFYATTSGNLAYDEDAAGGNPFASALIEAFAAPEVTLSDLSRELPDLTLAKSRKQQTPELPSIDKPALLSLDLKSSHERRVALVLGISHYLPEGNVPSLPGVAYDVRRIAKALEASGFVTQAVIDPDKRALRQQLQAFSVRSRGADISVLYATGHSVEVNGGIHLLFGDFPLREGRLALEKHSVPIAVLVNAGRSRRANLVFYGGCRNNPFTP